MCAEQLVQKQRVDLDCGEAPMAVTEENHKQMSATPACTMERVEMAAASYVYYYT